MATVTATVAQVGSSMPPCYSVTWSSMGTGDTGNWVFVGHLVDRSVHLIGTLTEFDLLGSNDGGSNSAVLNDPQGAPISDGSARIVAILENTAYVKPLVTTGTSVSVILFGRSGYS